ncbi:MAG: YggT family protein [Caulobacteraceae bacterium]|nr:YggT family protein [Caulobacter sp.]
MGSAILFIFHALVDLAILVVFVSAALSWLIQFDVINVRNPTVRQIVQWLDRIVDPMLRPIRRVLPNLGGVDISPIILLILLKALEILVDRTVAGPLVAALG